MSEASSGLPGVLPGPRPRRGAWPQAAPSPQARGLLLALTDVVVVQAVVLAAAAGVSALGPFTSWLAAWEPWLAVAAAVATVVVNLHLSLYETRTLRGCWFSRCGGLRCEAARGPRCSAAA